MTGPTPAPNALGEGSWTDMPTTTVPTNGHAAPYGIGQAAGVLPGDQRTFDDIEAGIVALWQSYGLRREQPLRDRLVLVMVNEAARCLEESVVTAPEDVDFGMIMGTGWAPFRGGS